MSTLPAALNVHLPALRDYQLPMLTSTAHDDATVSAPQLGKTIVLGLWELAGALRDSHHGVTLPTWHVAPTFQLCEQGMQKLSAMARSAGVLKGERWTPYPRLTLRTGATIEGRSWDQPDSLMGPTVARIGVDEFGQLTRGAYAAIRSRTSETRTRGLGFCRFAGNVGEVGEAGEAVWRHATSGAPGWAARVWTWRDRAMAARCECTLPADVSGLELDQAELHRAGCDRSRYLKDMLDVQGSIGPLHFRQLYGAEWLDYSALPAYTFERDVHVSATKAELQPNLDLDLSTDFNVGPLCWIIGQHRGEEAWASHELVIPGGATTQLACTEFLRRFPVEQFNPRGSRVLNLYGDASGKSHSTKSTETDYEIIKAALRPSWPGLTMHVPAANPLVTERLNAVNARLRSGTGEVRYYVHPRCRVLADDLARVSLKPGTRDLDKSNKTLTHASDADGYRLAELFPVESALSAARATVCTFDPTWDGGIMTMGF